MQKKATKFFQIRKIYMQKKGPKMQKKKIQKS